MTTSSPPQPLADASVDSAASLETLERSLTQSLEQVLRLAVGHHQSGQLESAEDLYRAVLDAQPGHAQANYHLGRLAVQLNQVAAALPCFATALQVQPERVEHWLAYLDALLRAGEPEAARELLALGLENGLEGPATQLMAARLEQGADGRDEAPTSQAAATESVSPAGARSRGKGEKPAFGATRRQARGTATPGRKEIDKLATLYQQGRHAEAEALAGSLTRRFPAHVFCWKILGVAILAQGRFEDALGPVQTAAALSPRDAEAHSNLGMTFKALGRSREAEASYRRVLQIAPASAEAHNNLAITLRGQGRLADAERHCRRALELKPDSAQAHGNLGNILRDLGRHAQAEESYLRAVALSPLYVEGHNNHGVLLQEQGRLAQAEASLRRALELDPGLVDAHDNLGAVLQSQGRIDEAEASFRRALELDPQRTATASNLLFCLSHSEKVEPQSLFAEHRRFGEQFEPPLRASWKAHSNAADPQRPLAIGFVSADLHSHALAFFIEPVWAHLAGHAELSLHAYSSHAMEDDVSGRLRALVKHWHPVAGLGDAALADKIWEDGIDILIDLSGHTCGHRLLAFARKPAPVQVSWMGYPGTTGLRSIDYYLTDRFLLPPGRLDWQFTERLVHLPANAPFRPMPEAPPPNALPALRNGHLTFGSFNRSNKLSPGVIALWSRLLRALPSSRMVLGAMPQDGHYETLIEGFAAGGVARERLSFHSRAGMDEYLSLHHQVDVCLDAFPYNGGTTTLHALWMGVPTLTLAGDTPSGCVGAGILGHLGLGRFLARSAEEFVHQGVALSRDVSMLAELRSGLRERFEQSALQQPALIADGLACALRTMWKRWCAGLPPVSFEAMTAGAATAIPETQA